MRRRNRRNSVSLLSTPILHLLHQREIQRLKPIEEDRRIGLEFETLGADVRSEYCRWRMAVRTVVLSVILRTSFLDWAFHLTQYRA